MTEVHPNHVHPRSKRTSKAEPYRALFKPLVPVKAGKSQRRKAETYRGARRKAERGPRKSLQLLAIRTVLGISRQEHDRRREEARKLLLA
jgi:hypothetical protein